MLCFSLPSLLLDFGVFPDTSEGEITFLAYKRRCHTSVTLSKELFIIPHNVKQSLLKASKNEPIVVQKIFRLE